MRQQLRKVYGRRSGEKHLSLSPERLVVEGSSGGWIQEATARLNEMEDEIERTKEKSVVKMCQLIPHRRT